MFYFIALLRIIVSPINCKSVQAAKEARYDKESVMKFFRMVYIYLFIFTFGLVNLVNDLNFVLLNVQLVRRRYFSDELPMTSPWSTSVQRPLQRPGDSFIDEDQLYTSTRYDILWSCAMRIYSVSLLHILYG